MRHSLPVICLPDSWWGASHPIMIYRDHKNLVYLLSAKRLKPCQARWAFSLLASSFTSPTGQDVKMVKLMPSAVCSWFLQREQHLTLFCQSRISYGFSRISSLQVSKPPANAGKQRLLYSWARRGSYGIKTRTLSYHKWDCGSRRLVTNSN